MLDKLAKHLQDKKNLMKNQQLNSKQTNSIDVNQEANPNPPIDTGMINQRFGFNSAQNNPYSNGTGSARSNINPMAQNALQKFRQGTDMGDYMFNRQQAPAPAPAPLPGEAPIQGGNANMGASSGVKPKKQAKREAKAYAAKHGLRGKAKKEMVKEAKKGESFDAKTNSQSKKIEEKKEILSQDVSGASSNGRNPKSRKKTTYTKQITKKSGEVKSKDISAKKYDRKADRAFKQLDRSLTKKKSGEFRKKPKTFETSSTKREHIGGSDAEKNRELDIKYPINGPRINHDPTHTKTTRTNTIKTKRRRENPARDKKFIITSVETTKYKEPYKDKRKFTSWNKLRSEYEAEMKGGAPMKGDTKTEAQRRKEAQDKAMGDNTTNKKGLGRAIEKIKDRNDVIGYTYENDKGGTTGVVTTKKKVRKEQRKSDPSPKTKETKSSTKNTKTKSYKVKSKKPKGIYLDGKGKSLSSRKHNKRKKKLYKSR